MKVKVDRQVSVTLVMNGEEAQWLMAHMKNSLVHIDSDNNIVTETGEDATHRNCFYQQLHRELDT